MAKATKDPNDVFSPCTGWMRMHEHWQLPDTLLGGTLAMRAAGKTYLPKEPKEKQQKWQARLDRSVLYNGYEDSLDNLTSRPFSREVAIAIDLPESLQVLEDDCDGFGTSFHNFTRGCYYEAVHRGIVHILVDFPPAPAERTKEDEQKWGVRPYFRMVTSPELIGWRFESFSPYAPPVLSQIRIKEDVVEPDGAYGDQETSYVKVIERDKWERHKKTDNSNTTIVESQGVNTLGKIYMVSIYFNKSKNKLMVAKPCLEGLAWMNLAHWQSYSDQRNILRFARTGILFGKGMKEEDVNKDITIGPNFSFLTESENADLSYVEHNGNAIEAGEHDIESIEAKMNQLGMQPFISSTKEETATGKEIDESRNQSDVQTWIMAMEQGIVDALKLAYEWIDEEPPDDLDVDIYSDFSVVTRGTQDLDTIDKGRARGDISQRTYLNECKRRDVLSETVDVDQEVEDTKGETMSGGIPFNPEKSLEPGSEKNGEEQ